MSRKGPELHSTGGFWLLVGALLLVAIARSKSDVVDHFERLEHIWQEYGVFVSMEEENQ